MDYLASAKKWGVRARALSALALFFVSGLSSCGKLQAPTANGITAANSKFDHVGVTSCSICHAPERPGVPVNSYLHSAAAMGLQDCSLCHLSPGVSWAGAVHQHTPSATVVCQSCHMNDRPATITYPNNIVASGHFNSVDCVSCHLPLGFLPGPTSSPGASTSFTFTHTNVLNQNIGFCTPCHTSEAPKGFVNGFNHSTVGTKDCVNCHTRFTTWAGGTR